LDINNCEEKFAAKKVDQIIRTIKPVEIRSCIPAPTCNDSIKNQDETDIDCGGSICPQCEDGKICKTDNDCINKCDPSTNRCYLLKLPIIKYPKAVSLINIAVKRIELFIRNNIKYLYALLIILIIFLIIYKRYRKQVYGFIIYNNFYNKEIKKEKKSRKKILTKVKQVLKKIKKQIIKQLKSKRKRIHQLIQK